MSLSYLKNRHGDKMPAFSRLGICLCFAMYSGFAPAAEWSVRGNLYQELGYDDNVRMSATSPKDSFIYRIIPTINFKHQTDNTEVGAHASYGTQVFTGIPQFSQDIQNYGANGLYKTERIDWGLRFNYSITPSRNTVIEDTSDPATSPDKTTWSIAPMMSYKLSLIDNLVFSPSFMESTFNQAGGVNSGVTTPTGLTYRNNSTKNFNLGWQRTWTERYSSNLSVFYSNYEFNSSANNGAIRTNDSFGLNLGNTYGWSENLSLTGSIGIRHSTSSGGQNLPDASSTGFLADVGANYTAENYTAGLSFYRSLMPSNFGQLQELTGTRLNFAYKIDQRLSVGLDMSYQDSNSVNATNTGSQQRENIVVHPNLKWLVAKDWSLSASYRYRTFDQSGFQNVGNANATTRSADSNYFMLSVNYTWPGFNISK